MRGSKARRRSSPDGLITVLTFGSVLSGTLLIPAVRPYFAAVMPGHEGSMHAFMAINMLGAIIGAPYLARLADRTGARRTLLISLVLLDAVLLVAMACGPSVSVLLTLRLVQGAANVGALSLLLGGIGAERAGAGHGRAFGAAAAAMITAVAAGGPLGTLLLGIGPRAPLMASGMIEFVIAGLVWSRVSFSGVPAKRSGFAALLRAAPLVRLPALWVAVERFAVGTFVVTFSLYAHRALGLSDRRVGALISCFLVSFALASYPLGRLADRINRGALIFAGMATYGICFLMLAIGSPSALPAILVATGLASAAIYSPSLCLAASMAPPDLRATSMSLLNASGSLGMMVGTATAGALAGGLRAAGWGDRSYPAVFVLAGAAQLLTLLASLRGLARLSQTNGVSSEDAERQGAM